ncbi:15915_t:CDS:2, partial [Acaulospora morrowiae]
MTDERYIILMIGNTGTRLGSDSNIKVAGWVRKGWKSTKTTVVKVLLQLEFSEDKMLMEVDVNDEVAVMMLPSW